MARARSEFVDRHIGPDAAETSIMLKELSENSLQEFIAKVVPSNILLEEKLAKSMPTAISEEATIAQLRILAGKNRVLKSLIGSGYYGTITPPVILRNVLENPAWYTAYTPYQPEISQGRLEAIFAFQTLVADLTDLPIANASMLDEASAAAEEFGKVMTPRYF